MLPDPLHPAIVHFPLVLSVLLPVAVGWAMFRMRHDTSVLMAWIPALALGALLVITATIALETGEDQEDAVEAVVAHELIHEHEEAGEILQRTSILALVLILVGVLPRVPERLSSIARVLALLVSIALVPLMVRSGSSGGELVYRHGAAQVYLE